MITNLKGYLLPGGDHGAEPLETTSVTEDGITLVSVSGASKAPLDPDLGAKITFDLGSVEGFMADFRRCPFWCKPSFGRDLKDVPDETQGMIISRGNGNYAVLLPLVSDTYKCVLCGTDTGLIAKLYSRFEGLTECRAPAFLYAEGDDPYALLERCAKRGAALLGNRCKLRGERQYPEIFEYLGWCSWDAMEIRVNHADLMKKCEEFREKNIPVKWAIIDDMWEEVHDFYDASYENRDEMFKLMHASKLYSHKADPKRFPFGLKKCISDMKEYGIRVGLWHPTTGYWAGIDPNGSLYAEHPDLFVEAQNGRIVCDFRTENAYRYYTLLHDYFKESGAEFVKIDNQSGINLSYYNRMAPVGKVAREYHDAMERSVAEHFDNAMINCMGMASEDMWNRTESPVSRCSGDFLPNDSEWFIQHITMCAYNDLIQGQFYFCDWDMWWTGDGQALKNSILRAVSGGPVYISDRLDESFAEIIAPLVLNDGRILRCDRPAVPTRDCLIHDPVTSGSVFKIQNTCGDCGVLAAFHIDEKGLPVKGTVSPSDIEGLAGDRFAVYEHFSKECVIMKKDELLDLELKDKDDFRLYIIAPYVDGFAAIGRTDKFISPGTVRSVAGRKVTLVEEGEYAVVEDGQLKFLK